MTPLITLEVHETLRRAVESGLPVAACSLDLGRSTATVRVNATNWVWREMHFPYMQACKSRTIYYWDGAAFTPVARFTQSLIKLVPTPWGPPTFEIDGIKMLPTAQVSPYEDAARKVAWIDPRDKVILDTCGGLGYFAAWCLQGGARQVQSFEKNADVLWLRSLNPWSPNNDSRLVLTLGDVAERIATIASDSVDAALHDPPRFGIAGELYSQTFYHHLARVLRPGGRLFHYTGTPNKLTSGRDLPREVTKRLQAAGFRAEPKGDGVLAVKR